MNTPLTNNPRLLNLNDQSVHTLEQTTIVGRHEDCTMVLNSERGASRKHARITVENGTTILMDLGSLNGTMVNGREISRAVQLSDGDIVVFDEQEYQFVKPSLPEQNSSDNVTVIANKDEIGRPESIKPAIQIVDTPEFKPQVPLEQQAQSNASPTSFDDTEAWEIPATSRPGGDAQTPRRLQAKNIKATRTRPVWKSWFVVAPLLILFMLVAFYFAYTAGVDAGTAGNPTNSS